MCLESVDDMLENELISKLRAPETGAITHVDGLPLSQYMPEYLVWSAIPSKNLIIQDQFKIIDFGQSFESGKRPAKLNTPTVLRAPEVIFGDDWDKRVDLWTMGCTVRSRFR